MNIEFKPTLANTKTENIIAMQKRYTEYRKKAKDERIYHMYNEMLRSVQLELESRGAA